MLLLSHTSSYYVVLRNVIRSKLRSQDQAMSHGATPLFLACSAGHTDVVRLLLKRGASVCAWVAFHICFAHSSTCATNHNSWPRLKDTPYERNLECCSGYPFVRHVVPGSTRGTQNRTGVIFNRGYEMLQFGVMSARTTAPSRLKSQRSMGPPLCSPRVEANTWRLSTCF